MLRSPKMSMFRAKKLDLGCFVNIHIIRDHTKRKVYEKYEAERYVFWERGGGVKSNSKRWDLDARGDGFLPGWMA